MSCRMNYKGKDYSETDFKAISAVHQSIKEELIATTAFEPKKGNLYVAKLNTTRQKKAYAKIGEINRRYGTLVVSARNPARQVHINVNPVADAILQAARDSNKPGFIQGEFLFQKIQENAEKSTPNGIINEALKSFLQTNNISMKYWDSLVELTGHDAEAAYDVINRTVHVAEGRENLDTLPEETGHAIVETLGKDSALVKSLVHHVSQMDYMSIIDPEYAKTYQNNRDMLIREASAQLIGQVITGKIKVPIAERPMNLIQKLIHSFLNLFTRTTGFDAHMKEAVAKASKLAEMALTGVKFDETKYNSFQDQPTNQFFFQKQKVEKKTSTKASQEQATRINYIKKRIQALEREVSKEKDQVEKDRIFEKLDTLRTKFTEYKNNPTLSNITEIMRPMLYEVEQFIRKVQTGDVNIDDVSRKDILFARDVIQRSKFTNIASEANALDNDLAPIITKLFAHQATKELGMPDEITPDDINSIEQDINWIEGGVGALVNKHNYVGQTVAIMIKKSQNRILRFDDEISRKIDDEVIKLKKYQNAKGLKGNDIYKVFIQNTGKTTVLTREYNEKFYSDRKKAFKDTHSEDQKTKEAAFVWIKQNFDEDGKVIPKKEYTNQNYQTIQNTPALKAFYDFFKKTTDEAFEKLPVQGSPNFIANLKDKMITQIFKSEGVRGGILSAVNDVLGTQEVKEDKVSNEDLFSDEIQLRFLNPLGKSEKSSDLGNVLLIFSKFANAHNEMSEILPFARLAQEKIGEKEYKSSVNPGRTYSGLKSNIYQMIEKHIDIQIKGITKVPLKKFEYTVHDENGKEIKKFFDLGTIVDFGVKYNSLLRIGLNPFLAVSNVIQGDINSLIDAVGGRFYNTSQLAKSAAIYYLQIYNKDSKLNVMHRKLRLLRQLNEYQPVNKDRLKDRISLAQVEKIMYAPQARGELFIQSKIMVASMLHDQIVDKNGQKHALWDAWDEKGEWKSELFGELTEDRIGIIVNKIQEIISKSQGRYSSEDAATWSQNAIFRAAFQFKKWIPAAVESRMDKYGWNPMLREWDEGRWRTGNRLIKEAFFSKDPGKRGYMNMVKSVFDSKFRLEQGGLTDMEAANIRKNLIEITLLAATIVLGAHFLGHDYRKKHKDILGNPSVKFIMDQLNRISGDLAFFTSPGQLTQMAQNTIPLMKTAQDLGTTLINLPYVFGGVDATYKKGGMAGENKFMAHFLRNIPGLNSFMKVKTNFRKDVPAPDYNQQSR